MIGQVNEGMGVLQARAVAAVLVIRVLAATGERDKVAKPGPRSPIRDLQYAPGRSAQPGRRRRSANLQTREYSAYLSWKFRQV